MSVAWQRAVIVDLHLLRGGGRSVLARARPARSSGPLAYGCRRSELARAARWPSCERRSGRAVRPRAMAAAWRRQPCLHVRQHGAIDHAGVHDRLEMPSKRAGPCEDIAGSCSVCEAHKEARGWASDCGVSTQRRWRRAAHLLMHSAQRIGGRPRPTRSHNHRSRTARCCSVCVWQTMTP